MDAIRRLACALLGHRCRTVPHPLLGCVWHECTRCRRGYWNDRLGVTFRCRCTLEA